MRQLRVDVIISLKIGSQHVGEKTIDTYLPTLKEDLQSFIRKMDGIRAELVEKYPTETEFTTGSINLDLVNVRFQNQLLTRDNELFKSIQAMIFEL